MQNMGARMFSTNLLCKITSVLAPSAAGLTQLADLIQGGKLHTRVGEVLPLSDANLTEPCPGIVPHRQGQSPLPRRKPTSILFGAVRICGLIRHLDAHHMRPSLALKVQRLALGRIKVRRLAGVDGDRHAGGL